MPYRHVVLGTDGSEFATGAERAAAAIALACDAELYVVCVDDDAKRAGAALERAAKTASDKGVEVDTEAVSGSAADALCEIADRSGAGLIALGSRGLSMGTAILGSVASAVANRGPCDVLLVASRGDEAKAHDYGRILIATDGSATADRAADRGVQLAERFGSAVTLLFVGHPKTGEMVLQDTASTFGPHFEANLLILQGDPADMIMEGAEKVDAGLIVVGNKGLTGVRGKLLGSVPKRVSEFAPRDVLIVRTVTQSLSGIKSGSGGLVEVKGKTVAAYRDDAGGVHKLSPKCTHLGCTVGWNGADKTWDCPCHGSRYAPAGEVVQGPAKKALEKLG